MPEEAKKETWVSKTPDEFVGPTTRRMLEVTNAIGLPFQVAHRHINFEKCEYGCKTASFGCKRGAKWMGYYAAQEAVEHGARLQTYTDVRNVIVENGAAAGVIARDVRDGHYYEIRGQTVVCTAGGIGSAGILTRSGVRGAGLRLFGDPSFGSTGLLPAGDLKSHFYEHGTSSFDRAANEQKPSDNRSTDRRQNRNSVPHGRPAAQACSACGLRGKAASSEQKELLRRSVRTFPTGTPAASARAAR